MPEAAPSQQDIGPALRISGAAAAYGRQTVLREVSLEMSAGEILAIVGPNGSGKSSLLKLALGILKPREGAIQWFGRPLAAWGRRDLARRVAYLPQSPTALPGQSVEEVLASGRAPYWGAFGAESPADRKAVAESSDLLGLADWLRRDIETLSGGQRQRVFIARCVAQTIAHAPATPAARAAILLDEPDTFLDLRHISDLAATLRLLARGRRLGILLASHDLNMAAAVADRMVLLADGAIAAAGAPAEVMQPAIVERVYGVKVAAVESAGRRVLVPA